MCRLVLLVAALAVLMPDLSPPLRAEALTMEREQALKPGDSFKDCDTCPEMVVLPAGSFTMGSPESEKGRNSWEGPQRVVTFARPFAIGKYEIRVGEFAAFVRDSNDADAKCWTFENGKFDVRSGRSWRNPGFPQDDSHPATCVNWYDAKAYAAWLGQKTGKDYRLPSEAQWEYAARGKTTPGSGPRFSFGEDERAICAHANALDQTAKGRLPSSSTWDFIACQDAYAFTAPTGRFAPNGFGLYDMHGNVKEWTLDCYREGQGYRGAPTDGTAWAAIDCSSRVLRGGSWLSYARLLRAAFRYKGGENDRTSDVGLRVVRSLMVP
jgi:formylglycine-generating enzyme required for sulfatase activity